MIMSHSVENYWRLQDFDVRNASLHQKHKHEQTVYVREMERSNGQFTHGYNIFILTKNLYGNPSGTYYYVEGLLVFLSQQQ